MNDTIETRPTEAAQPQSKALTDKQWMEQMWPGGDIRFGITDTTTGEFKEGYYDKHGMMAYRNPLPWWCRMFGQKSIQQVWGEWEYVTSVGGTEWMIDGGWFSKSTKHEWKVTGAVYRQTNKYNGARRYKICWPNHEHWINAAAFERDGQIIT